jgi:N4-(beta-N-acetylglucosaminyl)-L-asparaginase
MRQGKLPEEACLLACRRVNERVREKRLLDSKGRFKNNLKFYAINNRGEFGSAAIWSGEGANKAQFVIHDGTSVRILDSAYLFKREN